MAELTDRDVRQIVDQALTDVRSTLNTIYNAIRDTRSDMSGFVPSLTPLNNIHSNVSNLKGTVDIIKNDSARITDVANAMTQANANFTQLQQSLMRIETHVQNSAHVIGHVQQLRQDMAGLQQVLGNLEQFMVDMSQYLQNLEEDIQKKVQ